MEKTIEAIGITDLTFGYTNTPVLKDLSLLVKRGENVAIIGGNGTGKTTLLKLSLGLLRPWSGQIAILGEEMRFSKNQMYARKQIAYVPQERIIGKMPISVYDAVLLGRYGVSFKGIKKPAKVDKDIVIEAINEVGLSEFIKADVSTLSGGELQRMAIARGLVREAPIIFLDEPIAHLDKFAKEDIPSLLQNIQSERKFTMVTITHENINMDFDRVLKLQAGKLKEIQT